MPVGGGPARSAAVRPARPTFFGGSGAVLRGDGAEEGVVGAVLYTSYQLGSTLGIAIATAVMQSVNKNLPLDSTSQYQGYAASFWSLVGMHGLMIIIALLFVRN